MEGVDGFWNGDWSARGSGDLREADGASCEDADALTLGEETEGEAAPKSTLPFRARIFGERREARLESMAASFLASPSLYEEVVTPTVEPDLP